MIVASGLIGAAFLCGAALLLAWSLTARKPALAIRVRTAISPAATTAVPSLPGAAAARFLKAATRFGSSAELTKRLTRAGWRMSADSYRVRRLALSAAGCLIGMALSILGGSLQTLPVVGVIGFVLGHAASEYALSRAVCVRAIRLTGELPALAELLAFAVSAGESTTGALRRIVATSSGDLVGELAVALADVRAGTPLPVALTRMSDRVGVPAVQRFVDGLVVAADRGTPMAEVLRAQSADSRAHGQRMLIEAAGRREVFMLMPVVFLILPTVVVVALYPGLAALHLSVP